jgi:hypothetical protein
MFSLSPHLALSSHLLNKYTTHPPSPHQRQRQQYLVDGLDKRMREEVEVKTRERRERMEAERAKERARVEEEQARQKKAKQDAILQQRKQGMGAAVAAAAEGEGAAEGEPESKVYLSRWANMFHKSPLHYKTPV